MSKMNNKNSTVKRVLLQIRPYLPTIILLLALAVVSVLCSLYIPVLVGDATKKPRIRDGGFKAYLYKTARNMALRHKSKRKCLFRLDELTDESDGQLLVEEVIRTEERNRILHFCMGEMNPDYREVLYLTYFEGMSYAQAAEVTGKTVKQITNMVYRGKESLRRLLEREGITNAES